MQQHPDYTRTRISKLAARLRQQIYPETEPLDSLEVSPQVDRISFSEAQALTYEPLALGRTFGPLWATYWCRGVARIPDSWQGHRVDLLWDTGGEACLWRDGRSVQGLNTNTAGDRRDAVLTRSAAGGEALDLAIEIACNNKFGNQPGPYRQVSRFVLEQAEIGRFDPQAWTLYFDLLVLVELEAELAKDGSDPAWGGRLLGELNRFANTFDETDRATWPGAGEILTALYQNAAAPYAHQLSAVGHAHIDTAWLWPLAETRRKCVRTFSSAVAYMDDYPEYRFACSQACQYQWMKTDHPALYSRIVSKVESGQWIPVGGTWVEPDCNLPSGESLCRQFLIGQRFFAAEFGRRCKEFWNPDVFGYNGQLPQIMHLAGIDRFLTQKLSWNRFNQPRHHTFLWRGIDGTEVLAHFPPADTYNADATVAQLRFNVRNYKDSDRSRHSYLLFGYGDGGGGPTREMLERLRRARDLQGLPRTEQRDAQSFFDCLSEDCSDLPVAVGELYFELHRGTYTTQAATKRGNRKSEWLLHDVEFLAAIAAQSDSFTYPRAELLALWQRLLLNQFHDILPGSSITLVYEDTARDYAWLAEQGTALRETALKALATTAAAGGMTPVNTLGVPRREVCRQPDGQLVAVVCPSYGFGKLSRPQAPLTVDEANDVITVANGRLTAVLGTDGRLLGLHCHGADREVMAGPGNVFELYQDRPNQWDAWDIDPSALETGRPIPPATSWELVEVSDLRVEIGFEYTLGTNSRLRQRVRLDADAAALAFHCEVDWQLDETMLKVAFPVAVQAMNATYEMQFGVVERPTHYTSSYDLAKYEVPGHRWADLSEHGFGVALLSESKYGFNTIDNVLRMTLLRATRTPDPQADRGQHRFAFAIYPHAGGWQTGGVVAAGLCFNAPVQWLPGTMPVQSFVEIDSPGLIVDTIKLAEDSSALVIRLYEAFGGRGLAQLSINLPFKTARFCNLLEDDGAAAVVEHDRVTIPYRPWQIITLKIE